ncbi:hypothetical protein PPACK8108_LOCUS23516 [Phakopsora pachyrhizi]|uniref:Uncharacterized protein n=1 Tax=Phakopsora pachyrhizi TaxID=170000 RepID=A0AAV0BR65_PHAPC|nr:hypothetical protein PPACK8108_LOCUS23516 [Phakopsora pachyrhizi]
MRPVFEKNNITWPDFSPNLKCILNNYERLLKSHEVRLLHRFWRISFYSMDNRMHEDIEAQYHLPKPNPKDHQQTENLINKLNSLIKLKLYKQQPKSSQPPILGTKQYHHLNLSLTLNHPVISNHSQTTHRSSPLTEPVQQLSITTACQETQPILLRTQSSNSLVCKPDLLRRALEDDRLERQLIGDSDLLIVRKDDEGMMLVMEDGEVSLEEEGSEDGFESCSEIRRNGSVGSSLEVGMDPLLVELELNSRLN